MSGKARIGLERLFTLASSNTNGMNNKWRRKSIQLILIWSVMEKEPCVNQSAVAGPPSTWSSPTRYWQGRRCSVPVRGDWLDVTAGPAAAQSQLLDIDSSRPAWCLVRRPGQLSEKYRLDLWWFRQESDDLLIKILPSCLQNIYFC